MSESFHNAPTYAEKAAIAPIRVLQKPVVPQVSDAMYFGGSAEQAVPIVDWILLAGGVARFFEATEAQFSREYDAEHWVPARPAHIKIVDADGGISYAFGDDWILLTDSGFKAVDAGTLAQDYSFV